MQTNIAEVGKGFVRLELVDVDAELEECTDAALLAEGWAASRCPRRTWAADRSCCRARCGG